MVAGVMLVPLASVAVRVTVTDSCAWALSGVSALLGRLNVSVRAMRGCAEPRVFGSGNVLLRFLPCLGLPCFGLDYLGQLALQRHVSRSVAVDYERERAGLALWLSPMRSPLGGWEEHVGALGADRARRFGRGSDDGRRHDSSRRRGRGLARTGRVRCGLQ